MDFKTLDKIPDLGAEFRKIVADKLPGVGVKRVADRDPATGVEVDGVTVDPRHLAAYNQAVGLRTGSELPVTYPFVLSFPLVMRIMRSGDFPYSPMGAVHISNQIEQTRALRLGEEFKLRVHARNVREHRRGLLVDLVTEVIVGAETVWAQTSTFLGMGATLDSAAPQEIKDRGQERGTRLPAAGEEPDVAQTALWMVTAEDIKQYADASGDKNPVHVSRIGARAFGFPNVIAHGMWTAARMLAPLEGRIGGALRYTVDFAKPVVLPARIAFWAQRDPDGGAWKLEVRKAKKPESVHAVAEVVEL